MDGKRLRHLSRRDLVEMLLELSRENKKLREQIEQLEMKLNDRTVTIENAGSLAEAALQLQDLFRAAQDASDLYVYNTEVRCQQMEQETRKRCVEALHEMENGIK